MAGSSDMQNAPSDERKRNKAGWRIAALFLIFWYALLGWLRFFIGFKFTDNFTSINLWPRPLYIAYSGLVIGIAFTIAILFIIIKIKFTALYVKILGIIFLIWLWFDHIWFGTREAFFNQLIITILITLVTLGLAFILVRKKDYIKGNNNDRK